MLSQDGQTFKSRHVLFEHLIGEGVDFQISLEVSLVRGEVEVTTPGQDEGDDFLVHRGGIKSV